MCEYSKNRLTTMNRVDIVALLCLFGVAVLYGTMFIRNGGGVGGYGGIEGFAVNGDDYDDEYAKIYERVFNDKGYVKYNISQIGATISAGKDREELEGYKILEAGCGVGADTELIKKLIGKNVVSVDKSASLIKIFKYNLPECQSKLGDLNFDGLFSEGQFDIVTALHNTLYHNDVGNMRHIIGNFAKWLKSGGILVLHMYDRTKLDPAPRDFSQYYTNKKDGKKHALTHFDSFIHDAHWAGGTGETGGTGGTDGTGEMTYNEKIVFRKSGNVKNMKHKLYFPDSSIVKAILKDAGFKFVKEIGLSSIGVKDAVVAVYKKSS